MFNIYRARARMTEPPKQILMGKKMAIRGGLYREYFRQDISYLKQLCYFRGLDYYDREWSSLLLSLAAQGKLSKVGKFDVHFIGDFNQDLDSSSAMIWVDYSVESGINPEIPWKKIDSSLCGVVRRRHPRTPPGENPYVDIDSSEDERPPNRRKSTSKTKKT